MEVFFVKRQKLASTKVCDVEVELELLAESSFFEQEMRERLKNTDRIMKMMSICLTRVPISGLGEPNIYQNMGVFTRMRGFYLAGI